MRDIKFRAWNDVDKMIIDWGVLKVSPVFFTSILNGKVRHHAAMQFTGLKDKNGVDIYEGDIVNHNGIGIGFVEYKERQAAFKIVFSGTTRKWFVDMLDREYGLLEVIGNIYENPELIPK